MKRRGRPPRRRRPWSTLASRAAQEGALASWFVPITSSRRQACAAAYADCCRPDSPAQHCGQESRWTSQAVMPQPAAGSSQRGSRAIPDHGSFQIGAIHVLIHIAQIRFADNQMVFAVFAFPHERVAAPSSDDSHNQARLPRMHTEPNAIGKPVPITDTDVVASHHCPHSSGPGQRRDRRSTAPVLLLVGQVTLNLWGSRREPSSYPHLESLLRAGQPSPDQALPSPFASAVRLERHDVARVAPQGGTTSCTTAR